MKKSFLLLAFILITSFCFAQGRYNAHLAEQSNRFEVGLGGGYIYDYGITLHGGYHLTHRVNVSSDISFARYYMDWISSIMYTYEAVPSLRGGFFFEVGASAGIGTTTHFDIAYPFLGPAIGIKHHISDHFAISSRAAWNTLSLMDIDCVEFNGALTLLYLF